MKNLLKTSILVLAFCFYALAQTDEPSSCPTVSVTGPAGISEPNELINYSVTVDAKGKDLTLQYIWSVSDGEIIEGQGTDNIKIKQPSEGCLTVAVEVKGLPAGCSNLASETMCIDLPPQAVKIDESSQPLAQIGKNRINEIVSALQNDPIARLYIIFKHKEKFPQKLAIKVERDISTSLIKGGIEKDRITTARVFGQTKSIEFWLVSAGAALPKIQDD